MDGESGASAFRAIADSTYDWETWVGPDGRTRWINPAVERLTGRTVAECMAMPDYPLCLVHPSDRPSIAEALRAAARGTAGNDLELRIQHGDGSVRWAAMSWQSLLTEAGRAVGYRTSALQTLIGTETVLVLVAGLLIGTVAAAAAVAPNLALGGSVPWARLAGLLAAVIATGVLVALLATANVARAPLIPSLRKE